ncbi:MAG: hypothetical protein VB018_03985 [Lachnospiraceae bacterium]|nr:hypothetical protein [Lachnospiraceae bacterium]
MAYIMAKNTYTSLDFWLNETINGLTEWIKDIEEVEKNNKK